MQRARVFRHLCYHLPMHILIWDVLRRARAGPITIGGRSDHSRYRHFKGGMRSVSIYSSALTPKEIGCIFSHDDAVFSGALASPAAAGAAVARPAIVGLVLVAAALVWWQ